MRNGASKIRRAGMQDAEPIRRMHLALCAEIYPDNTNQWILSSEGVSYLGRRLGGEGLALIATEGGEIAGYLLGGHRVSSDGDKSAGIESIFVHTEYRRRAVATALVNEFARWFTGCGLRGASVAVQPENAAARQLYLKAGFAEQGLIENGRTLILTIERPREAIE